MRLDALAADLVDQAGVEVLDREHLHRCGGAGAVDRRAGLTDEGQSIAIELPRKTLIEAAHLHLASWVEHPGMRAVAERHHAIHRVVDQPSVGGGLRGLAKFDAVDLGSAAGTNAIGNLRLERGEAASELASALRQDRCAGQAQAHEQRKRENKPSSHAKAFLSAGMIGSQPCSDLR